MAITTKSRTELKAYFVKNAIPTESDSADLIDAMLNQQEDGIAKPAAGPLQIQANGDANSPRKVLYIYGSFNDPDPGLVHQSECADKPGRPGHRARRAGNPGWQEFKPLVYRRRNWKCRHWDAHTDGLSCTWNAPAAKFSQEAVLPATASRIEMLPITDCGWRVRPRGNAGCGMPTAKFTQVWTNVNGDRARH